MSTELLKKVSLFEGLNDTEIKALADMTVTRTFAASSRPSYGAVRRTSSNSLETREKRAW